MTAATMTEIFGEPISIYTREQAIDDGVLVDVTEWASASKGFFGGFTAPVAMTREVWTLVDIDSKKGNRTYQSTRGRAHDVLFMASLAVRRTLHKLNQIQGQRDRDLVRAIFKVRIGRKNEVLVATLDGDGVTITVATPPVGGWRRS